MSAGSVLRGFAAATTRGLRRAVNEDALTVAGGLLNGEVRPPLCGELDGGHAVLAVADGMGGHAHGALASREAVADLISDTTRLVEPEGCVAAVRQADLHLHTLMLEQPESVGMGTTIAGVALLGASFCWFNVGDSRIYRLRHRRLEQLSIDDRRAGYSGSDAEGSPHGILQSLGGRRTIAPIYPHAGKEVLLPGDRLLLCSDGLTDMVLDAKVAEILMSCPDAALAARQLIEAALQNGGLDNVSLILVQ